jgi:CHAT domain-containing protein
MQSLPRIILAAGTLALLAGCGNKPTPEQLRADAVLVQARAAAARGEARSARPLLTTAFSLDLALGRAPAMAEEARAMADLYAASADFDSAFTWYALAIEQYRNAGDRASVWKATLAAAWVRREMGEERRAFGMYEEALRLARVFRDDDAVRDIQWAMLPCVRALDESDEEARILRELTQEYATAGNVPQQAAVLMESGNGKYGTRLYDRAAEDYLRAFMLSEQSRDSLGAVRATLRLAMTFEGAGRSRDALASYGDCLKRADRTHNASGERFEALVRVGNLYLRNRQFAEAVRFFQAARAAARKRGNELADAYLALQLGHCSVETSREAAFGLYREGYAALKTLDDPAGLAYAALCLGTLFQRNNQPNDALQYLKTAIEESDAATAPRATDDLYLACEQAYYGARRTPWYDDAIDILLQTGRYDEAFLYVGRRNSRELFGALSDWTHPAGGDTGQVSMDAYAAARGRHVGAQRAFIAAAGGSAPYGDVVAAVRAARERAWNDVRAAAAAAAKARKALDPFVRVSGVSIADVQKALPPGTALVQHVIARRSLYAFVVSSTKSTVQIAPYEKDRVYDVAREFVDLLVTRDAYADSSRAQQAAIEQRLREVNASAYDAFLRPIEGLIAGYTNLVVVLPRELPALPLHALARSGAQGGGYLAEQHAVSYLPTAGALLLPRPAQTPVREVVGVGYAGGSGWDVEYELRDIRAFYKDMRLHFDQEASLGTLQKERGDLLHLAARFSFNDDRPGNSYLVLTDGKSADPPRRVLLGELLSLPPWPTVVVSDLDNGRLGINPAEPYLFLANGTQQVIFTSHVPSRKEKKMFGELLYTALLGGASVRNAYHQAQMEMIKNPAFAGPFQWGWFVLWGR